MPAILARSFMTLQLRLLASRVISPRRRRAKWGLRRRQTEQHSRMPTSRSCERENACQSLALRSLTRGVSTSILRPCSVSSPSIIRVSPPSILRQCSVNAPSTLRLSPLVLRQFAITPPSILRQLCVTSPSILRQSCTDCDEFPHARVKA